MILDLDNIKFGLLVRIKLWGRQMRSQLAFATMIKNQLPLDA